MMIKLILCGLLLFGPVHAAEPLAQRFTRDVIHEDQAQQALLAVPLDAAVYAASAADFADLRLIDKEGVETPYWLQKIGGSKAVINRLPVRSAMPTLQKYGDNGIVVTVDLEQHETAAVDGMTVQTSQRDFEYALQVQGSDDGQNWRILVDKASIYDYSRFMAFGNRDIELPVNRYRHFKIVVSEAIETQASELLELSRSLHGDQEVRRDEKVDIRREPLHIERIEFWRNETETVPETERRFDYPLAGFNVSRDDAQKTTLIDIDAQFLPLNGLELKVASPNFSRHAEVKIPTQQGIETRMPTIAQASLEALHFKDLKREQTALHFPEQRRQRYRIVIHDQDNPPLKIDGVVGIGPGYQLLFLPQSGQTYRLRYGAEKAAIPHYDTAPIQELLRRGYQSLPAGLGPEITGAPSEKGFDLAKLLNSDGFLGLIMTVMVLVLGWSLYRVGKRV